MVATAFRGSRFFDGCGLFSGINFEFSGIIPNFSGIPLKFSGISSKISGIIMLSKNPTDKNGFLFPQNGQNLAILVNNGRHQNNQHVKTF